MKKLIAVVVVAVIGFAGWRYHTRSHAVASRENLLVDRLWVDHLPRNERDTFNIFALIDEPSVGIFEARSAWRGTFEAFRFEASGDQVRIVFPHTGDKLKLTAKATRCDKGDMDFCLDVEGADRGAKRYYSREGWEIGSVVDEDRLAATLAHKLAP